jgi:hypothetical protein
MARGARNDTAPTRVPGRSKRKRPHTPVRFRPSRNRFRINEVLAGHQGRRNISDPGAHARAVLPENGRHDGGRAGRDECGTWKTGDAVQLFRGPYMVTADGSRAALRRGVGRPVRHDQGNARHGGEPHFVIVQTSFVKSTNGPSERRHPGRFMNFEVRA